MSQAKPFEVELKFRVPAERITELTTRLLEMGARHIADRSQRDQYFRHPCRDFARTDEAFRVRQSDAESMLTYKGPKIDASSKTRREIEIGFDSHQLEAILALLEVLGFDPVRIVAKTRRDYVLLQSGRVIHVAVDTVEHVGTFVEIETMADSKSLDASRKELERIAKNLELNQQERRSYLELLIAGEDAA